MCVFQVAEGARAAAQAEGTRRAELAQHLEDMHMYMSMYKYTELHGPGGESPPGLVRPPQQAPLARVGRGS